MEGVNQTLISVDNSDKCSCYTLQLNSQATRKAVNVTMPTAAMTGVDYVASRVTGEPFDMVSSVTQLIRDRAI